MANEGEKQIGVRVSESLWQQFREDVERRKGRVKGQLGPEVERAIRAYIDASHGGDTNDRLARIESKLESLEGSIERAGETKKDSGLSKTVENRMAKIKETIEEESSGAPRVHEQVIEMAIKKHAGQSHPTIRQYKQLLQDEGEAFEDPRSDQSYYFRDAANFCSAVNQLAKENEIDGQTYNELVDETYGREWWQQQLERYEERNSQDTEAPGFQ